MDTKNILFTLLTSLVIPIVVTLVISFSTSCYFNTYFNFRNNLIEARKHLLLYSNIYLNNFLQDDELSQKATHAKSSLREIWANIKSSYQSIPKRSRRCFEYLKLIPDEKKLDYILGNLIFIQNSPIVYNSEKEKRENGYNELNERKKAIGEINEFINLYIK